MSDGKLNKVEIPLEIYRGTSREFLFDILDAEGNLYTPASGDILRFGVKERPEATQLVIEKNVELKSAQQVSVKLMPEDTIGLAPGRYRYDVCVESGADYWDAINNSEFKIRANITKHGGGG